MDNKGFVPDLYDSTVEFWNISKEMYAWYLDVLGTEVTVTRISESDKRKSILSATLTSTFEDNEHIEKFNWKLLINQSTMLPMWRRNTSTIEVYDITNRLQTGDLVAFEYYGVRYQFKIQSSSSYGIGKDICYQYTLAPIIEHKV